VKRKPKRSEAAVRVDKRPTKRPTRFFSSVIYENIKRTSRRDKELVEIAKIASVWQSTGRIARSAWALHPLHLCASSDTVKGRFSSFDDGRRGEGRCRDRQESNNFTRVRCLEFGNETVRERKLGRVGGEWPAVEVNVSNAILRRTENLG
jgi:hypothetical protein